MKKLLLLSMFILAGFVVAQAQSTYQFNNTSAHNWTYKIAGPAGPAAFINIPPFTIVTGTFGPSIVIPATWTATNTTLGCSVSGVITGPIGPVTPPFLCTAVSGITYQVGPGVGPVGTFTLRATFF